MRIKVPQLLHRIRSFFRQLTKTSNSAGRRFYSFFHSRLCDMKTQNLTKHYMQIVIAIGFLCLVTAFYQVLPIKKVSFEFLFFALITVGLGSRISIQIPRFKSHVTVSDTFIFLALFLFGGEAAIILAAFEAFARRGVFCTKKSRFFSMRQ